VPERSRLLELLAEEDVVALEQDLADVAPLLGRVLLGSGHFVLLPWQLRHVNNDVGYNVRHGSQAVLLKGGRHEGPRGVVANLLERVDDVDGIGKPSRSDPKERRFCMTEVSAMNTF
jgi:hypothetical protein